LHDGEFGGEVTLKPKETERVWVAFGGFPRRSVPELAQRIELDLTISATTEIKRTITLSDPGNRPIYGPRTGEFTALLQEAGFEVLTTSNLDSLLWGKLVINAAINPLTAIFRIPNGALLERPDTRQKMIAAAREAAAVATTLGIRLPYTDPITTVEAVAGRTAANRSSMLQDVERGAPTEIDAINGAVVKAGKQVGVATPINLALWQLVKGL